MAASDTTSLLTPLTYFIARSRKVGDLIVFTQDWHPPDHFSFEENGGPWPRHCVRDSRGAEFMSPVKPEPTDWIVQKGTSSKGEGYSAFESTGLANRLRSVGVQRVGICGIATEYCVRATALEAKKSGFIVAVMTDLIRPVDPSASEAVLSELHQETISLVSSEAYLLGNGT